MYILYLHETGYHRNLCVSESVEYLHDYLKNLPKYKILSENIFSDTGGNIVINYELKGYFEEARIEKIQTI